MKTETNRILRSLVESQMAYLINERDCIINRITGSTMSGDDFDDATYSLSEICQHIREADDALTELRTEATQKQPCSAVPPLSEKTVETIRHLLEINLKSTNEASDYINCMLPLIPLGEKRDNIIFTAKSKECEASIALSQFNAAYPKKPKSK